MPVPASVASHVDHHIQVRIVHTIPRYATQRNSRIVDTVLVPLSLRLISASMSARLSTSVYGAVVVVALRYAIGVMPTVAGAISAHASVHVDVPCRLAVSLALNDDDWLTSLQRDRTDVVAIL